MSDAPKSRWTMWLPLLLFAAFAGVSLAVILLQRSRDVQSEMIGKPLPAFTLTAAVPGTPGLATSDFGSGKPKLLNVFASWCIPCAVEAPQLARLKAAGAEVFGVAIRDRTDDLQAFLAKNGNPYARIGADNISAVQLAMGSSGVPETFVVDGKGVIRYQHIGEIREDQVDMILAKLREAGQ